MTYSLEIRRAAEKDMENLPDPVLRRVVAKIRELRENPYQRGVKKLKGNMGFRLQVGSYRVIYDVSDSTRTVSVLSVRHRREAYR